MEMIKYILLLSVVFVSSCALLFMPYKFSVFSKNSKLYILENNVTLIDDGNNYYRFKNYKLLNTFIPANITEEDFPAIIDFGNVHPLKFVLDTDLFVCKEYKFIGTKQSCLDEYNKIDSIMTIVAIPIGLFVLD